MGSILYYILICFLYIQNKYESLKHLTFLRWIRFLLLIFRYLLEITIIWIEWSFKSKSFLLASRTYFNHTAISKVISNLLFLILKPKFYKMKHLISKYSYSIGIIRGEQLSRGLKHVPLIIYIKISEIYSWKKPTSNLRKQFQNDYFIFIWT